MRTLKLFAGAALCASMAFAQVTTIQGTDTLSSSRVTINGNFSWLNLNKVETASNTGSTGTGIFKAKSTTDLQFYKLASANNLITVALSGTDFVQLTLNPANFVNLTLSGNLTRTGMANGCAEWASGVLGTTSTACGSGSGITNSTITALTEDTTPDIAADFLITSDTSATALKKVKPTNLGFQPLDADLTTLAGKTISGTGANVRLSTGSYATDDCVKVDASGNFATAGAACGSGGGGGNAFSSTVAVSFSATPTFTVPSATTTGAVFKTTLTGNVTSSTLASAVSGQMLNFVICQDGTGGRSFAWPANVINGMTISSTRNSAASTCYGQTFAYDGTNAIGVKQITTGVSGGLAMNGDNEIDIDTAVVPRVGSANTFAALQTFGNGYIDVTRVSAPSSPASGTLRVYADNSDGQIKCKDSAGASCLASGGGGGASGATKYTIAFGALDAAGTSDETVVTLTGSQVVRGCHTKHSTAFTGGSLSAVTVSIGISGVVDLFCPPLDVFATAANTLHKEDPILWRAEGSQAVIAHFICTGGNCSTATAGSVDIYLWIEALP